MSKWIGLTVLQAPVFTEVQRHVHTSHSDLHEIISPKVFRPPDLFSSVTFLNYF